MAAQGRHGAGMGRRPRAERSGARNTPIEDFERMSPDEQKKALAKLPPERRQKIEEQLQTLKNLTPEQRSNLMQQYNRLNELPPGRQEAVRNALKKFGNQAPERQQAMRDELRALAPMTPEERQTRMGSPEFRNNYNHNEQQIIKDMSDLLPRN